MIFSAYTPVLLGEKVDVGDNAMDYSNSMTFGDVTNLIAEAGMTSCCGRMLYTEKWYTSMPLTISLFYSYGCRFYGMTAPTDKNVQNGDNVLFKKPSNGVIQQLTQD